MSEATPYFVIDANTCQPHEVRAEHEGQVINYTNLTSSKAYDQTSRHVTEYDSLCYPPLFAAISYISGDISSMRWETKRKTSAGSEHAIDHPTYDLLLRRPGDREDDPTANIFIESLIARALFYGLGAARITRGGPGHRPVRLELTYTPARVVERQHSGKSYRFYEWTDELGHLQQVRPQDMLVLNGPTLNGWKGMGLYDHARRVVGRALAASNYSDEFFTGGAVPQGWFVHPEEMSETAQRRFWENINKRHAERKPWGILEEDMKWIPSGISPADAKVVSLLDMSAADVARLTKIPVGKLGVEGSGKAPAKSVEQEQKNYFASCLLYWSRRMECEADAKLFREDEKTTHYTCMNATQFLALTQTTKERAEADQLDIMTAARTPDEVRDTRGLNPYPDGIGSKPLFPLNMTTNVANLDAESNTDPPANDDDTPDDPPADDTPDESTTDDERSTRLTFSRDALRDALVRIATRVNVGAVKAAKKPKSFLSYIDAMDERHRAAAIDAVRPTVSLIAFELRRDATSTVEATVNDMMTAAHQTYLRASECTPEQLPGNVEAAAATLRTAVDEIANQLCEI